jgi:hypothetical protein
MFITHQKQSEANQPIRTPYLSVSAILTMRKQKVERLLYKLVRESHKQNNRLKIEQAKRLIRAIDNRLNQISVQNLFIYN